MSCCCNWCKFHDDDDENPQYMLQIERVAGFNSDELITNYTL